MGWALLPPRTEEGPGPFLAQMRRYRSGGPLINVVDKELGFVTGGQG